MNSLPELPASYKWGTPKVDLVSGDFFGATQDNEFEVTVKIQHKPKWYIPAKTVMTKTIHLTPSMNQEDRLLAIFLDTSVLADELNKELSVV